MGAFKGSHPMLSCPTPIVQQEFPIPGMDSSLSNAYSGSRIQLSNIVPLDFSSILQLPETHAWEDSTPGDSAVSPPVIDLASDDVVERVRSACRVWGMFQVINHRVSESLIGEVEAQIQRLFSLPVEKKLLAIRSATGATGYGVARISPFFRKQMWHEGFTIMGSVAQHAQLLWPNDHHDFCCTMEEYQREMRTLARKLLLIIIKAMGVEDEEEEGIKSRISFLYDNPSEALQLNSYPICPNPNKAIGLAPHTDTFPLTILHQNNTYGLQVFRACSGWSPVPPVAGALVVNLGDLMHILSNACFTAAYHRVVPNADAQRLTCAYFVVPAMNSTVAPLPIFPVPYFRPVAVKEYVDLKEKNFEGALQSVKLPM